MEATSAKLLASEDQSEGPTPSTKQLQYLS